MFALICGDTHVQPVMSAIFPLKLLSSGNVLAMAGSFCSGMDGVVRTASVANLCFAGVCCITVELERRG
jgi:hypothetical protein